MVEYPQGWLSTLTEKDGNKQAAWRTDPEKWYERLYGRYWNTRTAC
jgi:hypothetical protein